MPMRSTCLIIPLCSCTHRAVHQPEICPIFPHGQTQRPNRRMCLEFGTLSILCLSSASETIRIQRPAVSRSTTALTDTLHAKRRHKAHPVDMAFFFFNPLPLSILLVSFSSSLSLTIPLWSQSVKSEVHVHNKKVTGQSCTLSLSLSPPSMSVTAECKTHSDSNKSSAAGVEAAKNENYVIISSSCHSKSVLFSPENTKDDV